MGSKGKKVFWSLVYLALAALLVALAFQPTPALAGSLQFGGDVTPLGAFVNRVEIRIDAPAVPADIGAGDFTIDFWIKADQANASNVASQRCNTNSGIDWIYGAIVIDRDRENQNRNYGLSLASGRILFGVVGSSGYAGGTICSLSDVRGTGWRHVAVGRSGSTFRLFVDGVLEAMRTIISTDFSYPNGVAGYSDGKDRMIVLGAEKHDFGAWNGCCAAFRGLLDELRLSPVNRWSSNFTPAQSPYALDAQTAALYHFDETSGNAVSDVAGLSPGTRRVGGNQRPGPNWVSDSPFGAEPPPPPPPPPLPVEVWHAVGGAVHAKVATGALGARIVVNGVPAAIAAGATCDAEDSAVDTGDGSTWLRVTGPALCDHALPVGQNVSGYARCEIEP